MACVRRLQPRCFQVYLVSIQWDSSRGSTRGSAWCQKHNAIDTAQTKDFEDCIRIREELALEETQSHYLGME